MRAAMAMMCLLGMIFGCKPVEQQSATNTIVGQANGYHYAFRIISVTERRTDSDQSEQNSQPFFAAIECAGKSQREAESTLATLEIGSLINQLYISDRVNDAGYRQIQIKDNFSGRLVTASQCRPIGNKLLTVKFIEGLFTDESWSSSRPSFESAQVFFLAFRGPYYEDQPERLSPQIIKLQNQASAELGLNAALIDYNVENLSKTFVDHDPIYNPCVAQDASLARGTSPWRSQFRCVDSQTLDAQVYRTRDYQATVKNLEQRILNLNMTRSTTGFGLTTYGRADYRNKTRRTASLFRGKTYNQDVLKGLQNRKIIFNNPNFLYTNNKGGFRPYKSNDYVFDSQVPNTNWLKFREASGSKNSVYYYDPKTKAKDGYKKINQKDNEWVRLGTAGLLSNTSKNVNLVSHGIGGKRLNEHKNQKSNILLAETMVLGGQGRKDDRARIYFSDAVQNIGSNDTEEVAMYDLPISYNKRGEWHYDMSSKTNRDQFSSTLSALGDSVMSNFSEYQASTGKERQRYLAEYQTQLKKLETLAAHQKDGKSSEYFDIKSFREDLNSLRDDETSTPTSVSGSGSNSKSAQPRPSNPSSDQNHGAVIEL